jgi:hypothetical protein
MLYESVTGRLLVPVVTGTRGVSSPIRACTGIVRTVVRKKHHRPHLILVSGHRSV